MTTAPSDNSVEAYADADGVATVIRNNPVRVLALVATLLALPFVLIGSGNQYWLTLVVELFIFGIAVLSFDLLFGYTGLLSFGHALFFGMGTYSVAIVSRETGLTFLGAVPIALVFVPVLAVGVGLVALRLQGVYFAILMLAFGQLGYQLVVQLTDLTDPYVAYYVSLVALAVVFVGLRRVVNSPFGHVLQGIHQNEERMQMLGINVYRHKLASFTLAAFVGGIGGLLYPLYLNFVDPSLLNWTTTGDMLMMTLIGGMGTLWGPILGAGFYIIIQGALETATDQWRIILGSVFVVFVLLFPSGIAGLLGEETSASTDIRAIRDRLRDALSIGGSDDE